MCSSDLLILKFSTLYESVYKIDDTGSFSENGEFSEIQNNCKNCYENYSKSKYENLKDILILTMIPIIDTEKTPKILTILVLKEIHRGPVIVRHESGDALSNSTLQSKKLRKFLVKDGITNLAN